MEFVHQTVGLIAAHKAWAGLLIGGLAFGESLLLIGVLVPGTAVLVIVGGFVGAGMVDPWTVLIGAAVGATLGQSVSFYLGVWAGRGALRRWPFNRYRDAVARARLFFRRYGFATVFVGLFFGPIRATVPLIAGMMGMNARRFLTATALASIVWAPIVLSPGWVMARSWGRFIRWVDADWFTPAALAAFAATLVALILVRIYLRSRPRDVVLPPTVEP